MKILKKLMALSSPPPLVKQKKYPEFKMTCPYWILRRIEGDVAHIIPSSQRFKKNPNKIVTSKVLYHDKTTGRIETENTIYLKWPPAEAGPSEISFLELYALVANGSSPENFITKSDNRDPIDFDFTIDNAMTGLSVEEVATELEMFLREERESEVTPSE